MTDKIAERFKRETAEHEMTVLHDDGLYRHLRFISPKNGFYWFDLISAPGTLIFQGDGESFTFRRLADMFEFFRGPVGKINPHYWSEKLTSGREQVMKYDDELFVTQVKEAFVEAARGEGVPAGTGKALREDVLDQDISYEASARDLLDSFEHKGFRFYDTWEWDFRDYDWWFLWACHGIVWGIAQYDAKPAPSLTRRLRTRAAKLLAGSLTPTPPKATKPQPPQPPRRTPAPRVIDVHLPEPTEVNA